MKVFTTDKIRNVVLLGHNECGKTSLLEAMASLSGDTTRLGSIDAGNTISDYDKLEIKHKMSIHTTLYPIVWGDTKINILDAPGAIDFVGETEAAISAADAAIIVVSGRTGVQSGTRRAWKLCEANNLPCMVYVSDMDIDDASYKDVVLELQNLYGKKIAPFHLPIRENKEFVGYINVIQEQAKRWKADGTVEKCDMPDYSIENLGIYREALMEAVAETNEDFLDRYFNGDTFSEDEIRQALRVNILDGQIVPVMMGSSILCRGVYTLLTDIVKYFPSPEKRSCTGINAQNNEVFQADFDFAKPKSAYVFKTIVDPFVGKYSLIKVNSGVIKTDDLLYNQHKDIEEKIGKIYVMKGSKAEEVAELHAGDIGALSKVSKLATTDSLSTKKNPILYIRTSFSKPYCCMRYKAKNEKEEDKCAESLQKIAAEDITFRVENDAANHQTLLYGMSEQHLEIVSERLKEIYKLEIELMKPKVAYRESIMGTSEVEYKHKKQSGGHGQYGHVKMKFEPLGTYDKAYEFAETVVGGAVPKNFFPAVEKGIAEATLSGPLAAYPVVGVKATLYDGSSHSVDSSEAAFKMAAMGAFKEGVLKAKPVLLEPIASLKVIVSDDKIGDVMGEINKRRAKVMGMNPEEDEMQSVDAEIPYAMLSGFDTVLRSLTGGEATYSYEFLRYETAPQDVTTAEIEARKDKLQEA